MLKQTKRPSFVSCAKGRDGRNVEDYAGLEMKVQSPRKPRRGSPGKAFSLRCKEII